MTTKLEVYNFALLNLGERKLASLTEARHPRYVFDDLWTTVTGYCLAQAMWKFALRATLSLTRTDGYFNFTYSYAKPSDIILPLCLSEFIGGEQLYNDVIDIGGFWYANVATLFARYTSNDATAGGMLLSGWTEGFTAYVAAALARRACLSVTSSKGLYDRVMQMEGEYYLAAASTDAVALTRGPLSFNAEARNRLAENREMQDAHLLPFAMHPIAVSRLNLGRPTDGGQE